MPLVFLGEITSMVKTVLGGNVANAGCCRAGIKQFLPDLLQFFLIHKLHRTQTEVAIKLELQGSGADANGFGNLSEQEGFVQILLDKVNGIGDRRR